MQAVSSPSTRVVYVKNNLDLLIMAQRRCGSTTEIQVAFNKVEIVDLTVCKEFNTRGNMIASSITAGNIFATQRMRTPMIEAEKGKFRVAKVWSELNVVGNSRFSKPLRADSEGIFKKDVYVYGNLWQVTGGKQTLIAANGSVATTIIDGNILVANNGTFGGKLMANSLTLSSSLSTSSITTNTILAASFIDSRNAYIGNLEVGGITHLKGNVRIDGVLTADVDGSSIVGVVPVVHGGTGNTFHSADRMLVGNGLDPLYSADSVYFDRNTGYIGIGTDQPTDPLTVIGDANITGNVKIGGFLLSGSAISTTGGTSVIQGDSIQGNGYYLSNLNADNIAFGVLAVERGGTGTSKLAATKLLVGNDYDPIQTADGLSWTNSTLSVTGAVATDTVNAHLVSAAMVWGTTGTIENFNAIDGRIERLTTDSVTSSSYYGNAFNLSSLNAASIEGVLEVSQGGTGSTEFTPQRLLFADGPVQSANALVWNDSNDSLTVTSDVGNVTLANGAISIASGNTRLLVDVQGNAARVQPVEGNLLLGPGMYVNGNSGWVGIQTPQPRSPLDVAGLLTANSMECKGVSTVGRKQSFSFTTQLGTTTGDSTEVCEVTVGSYSGCFFRITAVQEDRDNSACKMYELPLWQFERSGFVTSIWFKLLPTRESGDRDYIRGQNWDLDFYHDPDTIPRKILFRLRRSDIVVNGLDSIMGPVTGKGYSITIEAVEGVPGQLSVRELQISSTMTPVPFDFFDCGSGIWKSVYPWENKVYYPGDVTVSGGHDLRVSGVIYGDGSGLWNINMANAQTGVLGVPRGGTGNVYHTPYKVLVGNAEAPLFSAENITVDPRTGYVGIGDLGGQMPSDPLTVVGDAYYSNNVTIAGNLNVLGTQVIVNKETLAIDSNYVILNSSLTPSQTLPVSDSGLVVNRGIEGNAYMIFDESTETWRASLGDTTTQPSVFNTAPIARHKDDIRNRTVAFWNEIDRVYDYDSAFKYNADGTLNTYKIVADSTVTASGFVGIGSLLTQLNGSQVTTGCVAVTVGGTGKGTHDLNKLIVGNGTSAMYSASAITYDRVNGSVGFGTTPLASNRVTIGGNATLGGNLLPSESSMYDLGSEEKKWRKLYVSGGSVVIGNSVITSEPDSGILRYTDNFGVVRRILGLDATLVSNLNIANVTAGILSVEHGGTGTNTMTTSKLLVGNGTGSIISSDALHFDESVSGLGINTEPAYALDVSGDVNFTGNLLNNSEPLYFPWKEYNSTVYTANNVGIGISAQDLNNALYVNGDIYATSDIISRSDARMKYDLLPIDDALNKLKTLTGYTYFMKDDVSPGRRHAGLIAQQVESVCPELIHTQPSGIKGVTYGNFSALLVQAIKELSNQVEEIRTALKIQ